MASGIEHYGIAQAVAAEVREAIAAGRIGDEDTEQIVVLLAHGQLHATLALAAATALTAYSQGTETELADWEDMAGHRRSDTPARGAGS